MNGASVRPATHADLPGILAIYNDAVLHTTATYDYFPQTMEQRRGWLEEHLRDDYAVLVAVNAKGHVLGWAALNRFRERMGYRFTTESSIYVAANFRRQGVGSMLMPPLIDAARARGFHAMLAGIDGTNEPSLRLHERYGFTEVARFKEIGFKFNRWLDVVYLELLLEPPGQAPCSV